MKKVHNDKCYTTSAKHVSGSSGICFAAAVSIMAHRMKNGVTKRKGFRVRAKKKALFGHARRLFSRPRRQIKHDAVWPKIWRDRGGAVHRDGRGPISAKHMFLEVPVRHYSDKDGDKSELSKVVRIAQIIKSHPKINFQKAHFMYLIYYFHDV